LLHLGQLLTPIGVFIERETVYFTNFIELINTLCEENSLVGIHTHTRTQIAFLVAILIKVAVRDVPADEGFLSDRTAVPGVAIKKITFSNG
jgi:hypothetical protein